MTLVKKTLVSIVSVVTIPVTMSLRKSLNPKWRNVVLFALIMTAGALLLIVMWPRHPEPILLLLILSIVVFGFMLQRAERRRRRQVREMAGKIDSLQEGRTDLLFEGARDEALAPLAEALQRLAERWHRHTREQKELKRHLTRNEKLALLGELAATVAHEVNNPLDGLQSAAGIIRRNLDNTEQVLQLLDLMDSGLTRIETIVRRLLTMARDQPLTVKPTPLREIVDEAVLFAQPRFERHHIELVRRLPDEPLTLAADREQLVQVLINLLINAACAMPDGGQLTLRARCSKADRTQPKALLEIADTGCGITPEHLPHIFEPFYTTRPAGQGTGLGLAIVARIVDAHQGHIDVDTAPEKGTTFRLTLPLATTSDDARPHAQTEATGQPISSIEGSDS